MTEAEYRADRADAYREANGLIRSVVGEIGDDENAAVTILAVAEFLCGDNVNQGGS
ncbi:MULTISPECIES: hypothetical protein [unclassified Streptomyces]|uniref:hypothetical protein n=1 Tax=unclassified Streptomyces TaxID=2593676 RepID=UPI00382B13CA